MDRFVVLNLSRLDGGLFQFSLSRWLGLRPIDVRGLAADAPSGGLGPHGALIQPSIFQNAFFQRGRTWRDNRRRWNAWWRE